MRDPVIDEAAKGVSNNGRRSRKRTWTMQRIAEALGVTKKTISKDLADFNCCTAQQSKPAKTATNPKGAGSKEKSPAVASD